MVVRHAQRDGYFVIEWWRPNAFSLFDLFRRVPELVVDRYLVNTSFDSASLQLSEDEQRAGWRSIGDMTYSPKIGAPTQIPHAGFEEWLVFGSPATVGDYECMVNQATFTPMHFFITEKREQFWKQLRELRPMHVAGENDDMYLVTSDAALFEKAKTA